MSEAVELLTTDEDGHAVEGMKVPRDRGVIRYLDEEQEHLAYPHKFFRRNEAGQPMPETLVEFLVPDYMLVRGFPGTGALKLVAERMGWEQQR